MKSLEEYLHLKEADAEEIMNVLLHHFGNAQNISSGVYKYQKKDHTEHLEVYADVESGRIQKVIFSEEFPKDDLKKLEQTIKDNILTQSVSVAQGLIFCRERVTEFFRYKDEFQILPVPEGSPMPVLGIRDYPFLIEFKYNPSPDTMIDWSRRRKKTTIYTRILNLLVNQHLRLASNSGRSHWVMDIDESTNKASYSYKQEGYAPEGMKGKMKDFTDVAILTEMKGVPFQEYYTKTLGVTSDPLRIPDNLEASLDVVFNLRERDWDRFFMSCSWYSQSSEVWHNSGSSAFISLVTALECLVGEREKCDDCNQEIPDQLDFCDGCKQPRYQVAKGFKKFLERFVPFIDSYPREKKTLYGIRSKLAHGIDLLQHDLKPWTFIMNVKKDEQDLLHRNLHYISRVAMYNWLWSRKRLNTLTF